MIDVKLAVKKAIEYISSFYDTKDLSEFLLEEVELSDDEQYWYITIGFNRPKAKMHPLVELTCGLSNERVYKIFKIHTDDGKVMSMKIRELENVK